MSQKKDFFISYTKTDRRWAEWVAWHLEKAGYTTVIQAWDFRPGGHFVQQMHEAAAKTERTIAVLSPDYLSSKFTQPEWQEAFRRDPTGEKGLLVPVRVREGDPEGLLPQIVYIDLVGQSKEEARQVLLAGVQRGRARPKSEPVWPGSLEEQDEPQFPPDHPFPAIWNISHRRNLNFTGRKDVLEQLRAALTSGEPTAVT